MEASPAQRKPNPRRRPHKRHTIHAWDTTRLEGLVSFPRPEPILPRSLDTPKIVASNHWRHSSPSSPKPSLAPSFLYRFLTSERVHAPFLAQVEYHRIVLLLSMEGDVWLQLSGSSRSFNLSNRAITTTVFRVWWQPSQVCKDCLLNWYV